MEEQFGPVQLRIIYQTGTKRIARITAHNGTKPLELALVTFHPSALHEHESVHEQIVSGALLGKTLRSSGIPITRRGKLAHFIFNDDSLHAGFPGQSSACRRQRSLNCSLAIQRPFTRTLLSFIRLTFLWYLNRSSAVKNMCQLQSAPGSKSSKSLLTSGEKRYTIMSPFCLNRIGIAWYN